LIYAEVNKPSCTQPSQITRECADRMECRGGACTSSVQDTSSPNYEFSCPLDQQLANKTALEADCRCFANNSPVQGVPVCGRPYDRAAAGVTIGSGPRVFGLSNGHYSGGTIDGNEFIVAAYWGTSSVPRCAVLGINVNNGDRRLITGELGMTQAGSGPQLEHAVDVRKHGASYYVLTRGVGPAAPAIYRVNPANGARTLVWRGQNASFGQCAAGDPNAATQGIFVQYTAAGFEIDAQGRFYLGYVNPIRDGRGVVRISADGASCSYVAATGMRALIC
jgi:hypothetical protein